MYMYASGACCSFDDVWPVDFISGVDAKTLVKAMANTSDVVKLICRVSLSTSDLQIAVVADSSLTDYSSQARNCRSRDHSQAV